MTRPGGGPGGEPGASATTAVPEPPRGWGRVRWLGPGVLWMVAATGSGELLFTPRVGALYGYALLWALVLAVTLKWFVNREVGRYAVATGAPVLEGFRRLPGPRNWAVWLIVVPQVVVAVATVAGLAGAAATAAILLAPGSVGLWMVVLTLASGGLVLWGRYRGVEVTAKVVASVLGVAAIAAAASVFPGFRPVAAGLVPTLPARSDTSEILAWLGFMLSGAAGMMWYSYWLPAKGYGAGEHDDTAPPTDPKTLAPEDRTRLRGWLRQLTLDNTIAVVGALGIAVAFLVLGAELLRPKGLVPEEQQVAGVLGRLLGDVWGPVGFWFMVGAILLGFWGTTLSVQDGFGRLLGHGAVILLKPAGATGRWADAKFWRVVILVGLLTAAPAALYLAVGQPVGLLKLAGAIEAAHIPVVAGLTLYLNHCVLPAELRPSRWVFGLTALAGLFFAAFAAFAVYRLLAPG